MSALDRFEAFAAMVKDDGLAPSEIANRFGITERAVKEALRLGNAAIAYQQSPGFENNEGGFGTLTWDLGTDTIMLEHSNRYMETEDYVWEDL